MEQMSRILRREREHRKISLQEVERLTQIPLEYLQMLEGERDKRVLADPKSLLSSLRIYAAFLNINPAIAVTRFTAELQKLQWAVMEKGTKPLPKVTQFIAELEKLQPAEEKAGGSERPPQLFKLSPQRFRLLPRTILLLLALGILAVVWQYGEMPRWQWPKEDPASPPVAAVPQAEPSVASAPRVESPAVISPPQPQDPPDSPSHRLRVRAKEQAWLRVTIDGRYTKDFLLQPGQSVEWSAETGFMLTLGNAGGVELTLDGQILSPLGKSGQVVRNLRLLSGR